MPLTALALNNKYSLFCKELKPINLSCGALTCSQDYNKSIGVTPQNLLSHYREERSPYNFPSHVQCRPLMISSQSGVLCRRAELEVPTKASTDKNIYIYITFPHTQHYKFFRIKDISLGMPNLFASIQGLLLVTKPILTCEKPFLLAEDLNLYIQY